MSSYTFSRLSKSNESQTHCFRNFHPWITLCSWLSFVNYFLFVYRRYFKITIYRGVTETNIGIRRKRLSLKFTKSGHLFKASTTKMIKKRRKEKKQMGSAAFQRRTRSLYIGLFCFVSSVSFLFSVLFFFLFFFCIVFFPVNFTHFLLYRHRIWALPTPLSICLQTQKAPFFGIVRGLGLSRDLTASPEDIIEIQ